MGFDVDKFQSVNWQRRTEKVPVPALAEFFGKKEKPIWILQSIEGREVAQAKHARERNLRIKLHAEGFVDALNIKHESKFRKKIQETFGNLDAEADTAWRTELLILASVEPKVDYSLAALLHKVKSEVYYLLTNKIVDMIGEGFEAGKLSPSGKTNKSKAR